MTPELALPLTILFSNSCEPVCERFASGHFPSITFIIIRIVSSTFSVHERSPAIAYRSTARVASTRDKGRVMTDFSLQDFRQQTRLDLQHSSVAYPVIE